MEQPKQREMPGDSVDGLDNPTASAPSPLSPLPQKRAQAGAATSVPVASSPFPQAVLPSQPLLVRLRRQVDQERQSWYLLLICCGFFGLGSLGLLLGAFGGIAIFPVSMLSIAALVFFGERNYKRLLQQSLQDMLYGPMLLVVMDESFGRSIEEQRRERYRPVMRQVPLGDGLLERINHSAHYYKQYWRACNGLMEQPVPGLSQLSCFQDGLLIGFASCSAIFFLGLPLLVFAVIRLLDVWPRTLAVKQALLEILDGRHEAELEQIYAYQQLRRSQVAVKNESPQSQP